MNENLESKLIEFMDLALNGIESTTDFMSAELPLYVEQLLMWFLVYSLVKVVIGVTGFVSLYFAVKYALKVFKMEPPMGGNSNIFWDAYQHCDSEISSLGFFAAILLSLFCLIVGVASIEYFNLDWLQILIAPKVWLVEYVAKIGG